MWVVNLATRKRSILNCFSALRKVVGVF